MAAAEASFSTSIDSMSLGLISDKFPEKGIPSKITKGLFDAVMEFVPRISIVFDDPSALEEFSVTCKPAATPWSICSTLTLVFDSSTSLFTETTEPVMSLFFCVP